MPEARLAPKAIAKRLFDVDPDRDERASQLCTEALLTLVANNYQIPTGPLASPKLRRFGVRSLVFGENFLAGFTGEVQGSSMRAAEYGALLASGADFQGADNLSLARMALWNLIDASTEQGQHGQHLMLPFHESLLWYDARPAGGEFTVRKVRMRGSGITLARLLLDPPPIAGEEVADLGRRAVAGLREALSLPSPLAEIAASLEDVLPDDAREHPVVEDDEKASWALGADERLASFAAAVCRHAEGIVCQAGASGPARLWQLRTILALDLAIHALRRAWHVTATPEASRNLLMAIAGPDRQQDRVRLRSERSYDDARTVIRWATIEAMAAAMIELAEDPDTDWAAEVEGRTARLLEDSVMSALRNEGSKDFRALAQVAFENANYDRSGEGFRVLIESIGMSAGGTRYRFTSSTPDLLSALVGALSNAMPMTSSEFFRRIKSEWGLVVSPEAARDSVFSTELDGADLAVNARRFEQLMIEAGLASGLSDRTVLVGERVTRRSS